MTDNNPYAADSGADDDLFAADNKSDTEEDNQQTPGDGMTLGGSGEFLPNYLSEAITRFAEEQGIGSLQSYFGHSGRRGSILDGKLNPVAAAMGFVNGTYKWTSNMVSIGMMCHGRHFIDDHKDGTCDDQTMFSHMRQLVTSVLCLGVGHLFLQTQLKAMNDLATKYNASHSEDLQTGSIIFVNVVRVHTSIIKSWLDHTYDLYIEYLREGTEYLEVDGVVDQLVGLYESLRDKPRNGTFDAVKVTQDVEIVHDYSYAHSPKVASVSVL